MIALAADPRAEPGKKSYEVLQLPGQVIRDRYRDLNIAHEKNLVDGTHTLLATFSGVSHAFCHIAVAALSLQIKHPLLRSSQPTKTCTCAGIPRWEQYANVLAFDAGGNNGMNHPMQPFGLFRRSILLSSSKRAD